MAIFVVHLRYHESVTTYISWSLRCTSKSNPGTTIYLLTPSCELADFVDSLQIENVNTIRLSTQYFNSLSAACDQSFYHDAINPRWFDLACFVRHAIVAQFLDGLIPELEEIGSIAAANSNFAAIVDSDIGITSSLNSVCEDIAAKDVDVSSLSDASIYFSVWRADSFR